MEEAVLHTLEYDKIRTMLADSTSSVMGRELAAALLPSAEPTEVAERLAETAEARDILAAVTSVPLGGIRDIRMLLKRAELGAVLEPDELVAVSGTLYAARRLKHFFYELTVEAPRLTEAAGTIVVLREVESQIESAISEQGMIRDDASSELLRLRREIRSTQSKVKEKLDGILRSQEYQKFFQDNLVTMRGDRYVIPVKQEYRHSFPGIVHDQSASGATVFIEPMPVVQLNNDVKQLILAEKNEVERILQLLSGRVGAAADTIRSNSQVLAHLDFAFAKARLSFAMRAQQPSVQAGGAVKLQRARHPLIDADVVVPIDVVMSRQSPALLITGPNTGGKTVTLKTVGLFALMVQSGLFIPAASGSEMPIFRQIFADIGDEQSIEQSLSTFSAHMTHLVSFLHKVTPDDLVLIDEIGAGTDPEEGAALAMALLEHFLETGCKMIATTHYSELKTFAYSRSGIKNASVEFDVETLQPTYRLLIGVPGSSNAFAISRRLGLSEHVIKRAGQLIEKEHAELEDVLQALEKEKLEYQRRHDRVRQLEAELVTLRNTLEDEQRGLTERKSKILQKAQQDAAFLVRQAKQETEAIISEIKAQFSVKNEKDRQQAIHQVRQRLTGARNSLHTPDDDSFTLPPVKAAELQPGMEIFVASLQQKGSVLAISGQEVSVQIGIMKVNVPVAACHRLPETTNAAAKQRAAARAEARSKPLDIGQLKAVSRQIDIRGTTVEEAELILGKYLDDAIVGGLKEVIVIHGKGTGALRKGVRAYLKGHYHVRDISIGELNEGGDGATVVRLS